MLEDWAAQTDAGGSRGEGPSPLAPLLAVEVFESRVGFELLFFLPAPEDF